MKMNKFIYTEDRECESCGSDEVKTISHEGHKSGKRELCIICYSTLVANATEYPEQYPNVDLFTTIAQVGNLILKKLEEDK